MSDPTERKIEFILEMQAQFAANLSRSEVQIDNLRVAVGELRHSVGELRHSVAELAGIVSESIRISDDRFTRLDDRLAKLAEAQATTDRMVKELAKSHIELSESQKATDERLNALIGIVERHITGPGHSAQPYSGM
jgi:chromosome segregation ATPase